MKLEKTGELEVAGTTDVVVRRFLNTIERYREEGNKIPQIYMALVRKHGIKMTLGSFRNAYYRQRQNYTSDLPLSSPSATSQLQRDPPETPNKVSSDSKRSCKVVDKADPEPKAKKSVGEFKRLEIGGTLEQRRAIARAHFNQ